MNVSRKCQYALRAVLELARQHGGRPTTTGEIAEAQAIPPKFLELILGQLRQEGLIESRRGVRGGYLLAVAPSAIAVGRVIRLIDGPVGPVRCVNGNGREPDCPLRSRCCFMGVWSRAHDAVAQVYDSTTFQDLLDEEPRDGTEHVASYCI